MKRSPLKLLRARVARTSSDGMKCTECILLFLRKKPAKRRPCKGCEHYRVLQLISDLRQEFGFLLYDE